MFPIPSLSSAWLHLILLLCFNVQKTTCKIDRQAVVSTFNPHRNGSSYDTPMQVGNGNIAFSADITGLQTIQPFNTLSSWGWHNSSLPTTPNQTSVDDFTGLQWWTHGRLVTYDQPNPAEADISQWLISNPHRINLIRIGFHYNGLNISLAELTDVSQSLDLYSGIIHSNFSLNGTNVQVKTAMHPQGDSIGIEVESNLLSTASLGVFFDYPYATDSDKFDAPYVGVWNATANHTTSLYTRGQSATIQHDMDATTYSTDVKWQGNSSMVGPLPSTHRYVLSGSGSPKLSLAVTLSPASTSRTYTAGEIFQASSVWWDQYWQDGSIISFGQPDNEQSVELARRIVLSQYLLAVNEAGDQPPQESGLTNNGWYGKFHMEMVFWHTFHFTAWGRQSLTNRHVPRVYDQFLPTSLQRAHDMGYSGARWGKMSDPSGRSAPGEINSLLIWQQPHCFYFAEAEYQRYPTAETLQKWDDILTASADFMASFAYYNASTQVYDLGPPMYPVSENTNPNATINPTFELAYWQFGFDIAAKWQQRQNKTIPSTWQTVATNLPPLPIDSNDTYTIYEGLQDMWSDPDLTTDHPSMAMIYGLISPPPDFNVTIFNNTMQAIYSTWNLTASYGWDFPMLAIAAARLGDYDRAVDLLLDDAFQFDDVGMPIGGAKVPTPYFPGSGALLTAVAMMAAGWKDDPGQKFPNGWEVESEGFLPMFF